MGESVPAGAQHLGQWVLPLPPWDKGKPLHAGTLIHGQIGVLRSPSGMHSLPAGTHWWKCWRVWVVSFQSEANPGTEQGLSANTSPLKQPHRLFYLVFGQISSLGLPLGCVSCEAWLQAGMKSMKCHSERAKHREKVNIHSLSLLQLGPAMVWWCVGADS